MKLSTSIFYTVLNRQHQQRLLNFTRTAYNGIHSEEVPHSLQLQQNNIGFLLVQLHLQIVGTVVLTSIIRFSVLNLAHTVVKTATIGISVHETLIPANHSGQLESFRLIRQIAHQQRTQAHTTDFSYPLFVQLYQTFRTTWLLERFSYTTAQQCWVTTLYHALTCCPINFYSG